MFCPVVLFPENTEFSTLCRFRARICDHSNTGNHQYNCLIFNLLCMSTYVKCCVGIDVAKADFKAAYLCFDNQGDKINLGLETFTNSKSGFKALIKWTEQLNAGSKPSFAMEFTGRYSEPLANFLFDLNLTVFLISPFKSKRFRESYDADIKTDEADALTLATMGLERKLDAWKPDSEFFSQLKMLVRERYGLIKQSTALKNKLKSLKFSVTPIVATQKRHKQLLKLIRQQISEIDAQIDDHLKSQPDVCERVKKLKSITGVGMVTISTVLAETDGFQKVSSTRKLAAFAGYKVTQNQSGQFVGASHISKRGNKFIRHALHMPTLCIIQSNPVFKEKYQKLKARKAKPIIATTAIERKVLTLMYSIYKNNIKFDINYTKNVQQMT